MITAPFKFDVPSPDDLVSIGLRSSKMVSQGKVPLKSLKGSIAAKHHSLSDRNWHDADPNPAALAV
ncbi:hypothetical protein L1049_001202 [Liquidambar formosana]|uniref:Uncharacterized protein n=1 Tax=Liquidambar formosana TaxID=63359 RepID=A0AAP0R612_LIQFO